MIKIAINEFGIFWTILTYPFSSITPDFLKLKTEAGNPGMKPITGKDKRITFGGGCNFQQI